MGTSNVSTRLLLIILPEKSVAQVSCFIAGTKSIFITFPNFINQYISLLLVLCWWASTRETILALYNPLLFKPVFVVVTALLWPVNLQ